MSKRKLTLCIIIKNESNFRCDNFAIFNNFSFLCIKKYINSWFLLLVVVFLMRSHYRRIEGNNIFPQSSQTEWHSYFQAFLNPFWSARKRCCGQCQDTSLTSEKKAEAQVLSEPLLVCTA